MNFFETLIHPDREENPERGEVARAANYLQVGEFQLLQLAYFDWHGTDMPEGLSHQVFTAYMMYDRVPAWARHYARRINQAADLGGIDDQDPSYHRYDDEYVAHLPRGLPRFIVASAIIFGVLGGSLLLSHYLVQPGASLLPPYFEKRSLDAAPVEKLRGS